jgi:hypothetical protein
MNTTPLLVSNSLSGIEIHPSVYLGCALFAVAILAIALLVLFWNWVCAMRDRCIHRARIRQRFVVLPARSRIDIIERYRAYDGNTPPADTLDLLVEIAGYAAVTKTHHGDILAMLIDWHSTELTNVQPVANV